LFEGKPFRLQDPDPVRVASLEKEIADQKTKLAAAKAEDEKYSGGLVKAMTASQIATISNTIALLEQRVLAERYGLPYLSLAAPAQPSPAPTVNEAQRTVPAPTKQATPPLATKCDVSIEGFDISRE